MTPFRLWLRGLFAVLVLFAVGGIFLVSLESVILDLDPEATRSASAHSPLFLPILFVAVVGWTTVLFRRVQPLLGEAPTVEAYRAVLVLPADFVKGSIAFVIGACTADLLVQLQLGPIELGLAVAMDALAIAESATLLLLGWVLMRAAVRPVLRRMKPGILDEPSNERLATKLILACAIPVATFALALAILTERSISGSMARAAAGDVEADLAVLPGLTVADAPDPPPIPVGVWGVAALATALAALAGARLGRAVVADMRLATAELDATAQVGTRAPADPLAAGPTFREVQDLRGAIARMGERLEELSAAQQRSIEARSEAQRMKTQFLASMSHDLRSPLNSIIGFSELLMRGVEGELASAQRENVLIIHKSGNDLLRLINDILDSAKLEAGRMDVQKEWTPSVEILNETIRRSREFVGDKAIELIAELQPGLPPVHIDADRISQALLNIIANAFKFMEQGTVRVVARTGEGPPGPAGRYLQVEIADTGTGIREEDRESIFEAFRQIDGSSTRRSGGMGLGLSLARAIVELHGGKVWVESRLGAGSVFYVAVPLGE